MINVVIPEPIPSLNKGEAAILEGIWESLNKYGDYRITVYSPPAWIKDDRKNYVNKYTVADGIDLGDLANKFLENPKPRNRLYSLKIWGTLIGFSLITRISKKLALFLIKDNFLKSMAHADVILAGHDGMLGYEQFWLALATRIMNKPFALFGGGTDEKGRSGFKIRTFLQFAINNAIICTVRDPGTRDYLLANDIAPDKIHLFPDPAVLLKPCTPERVNEILTIENIPNPAEKPLFGLVPVRGGIVFDKSFSFETHLVKKHQHRVNLWVAILSHLLETTNAHFILIPHCIGPTPKNDDSRMCKDIYKTLPYSKERVTIIQNEYSASELKGLLKQCSFVVGERTHALIGSVSVGTPCIALTVEEDSRMHYIIDTMFCQNTFNLNNPNIDELKKLLTNAWNDRDKKALSTMEIAHRIHEQAYQAASLLVERIENALKRN